MKCDYGCPEHGWWCMLPGDHIGHEVECGCIVLFNFGKGSHGRVQICSPAAPAFPQSKLDALRAAADVFWCRVGQPIANPFDPIAFKVPEGAAALAEDAWCSRVLHMNCERVSPLYYPGRRCSGCDYDDFENHDRGDEDAAR